MTAAPAAPPRRRIGRRTSTTSTSATTAVKGTTPTTRTTRTTRTARTTGATVTTGASAPTPVLVSPTRDLGIAGWSRLDPLLVAALALEGPVLLVGAHGTAKTLVVERVADALGASFRHYNASLLNYDDLVGIPIPDEAGGLRFVGTEGAVWGASFVFFDEINRCRPDLQNKMFPIVHERRIGGVALSDLVHRWAAMNPPQDGGELGGYVGTEPLDEALADRFWFVVRTPGWDDLDRDDRVALLEGGAAAAPHDRGGAAAATHDQGGPTATRAQRGASTTAVADAGSALTRLVERTRALQPIVELELGRETTHYVVALVDALAGGGIAVSPRRARILRATLLATVAADRALDRANDVGAIYELVVLNGLPHWADATAPELVRVIGAHLQAFELAFADHDGSRARLLAEPDPVRRIRLALDLGLDDAAVALTATSALASRPSDAERHVLAAVLQFGLADRALTPSAWSTIHHGAARIIEEGEHVERVRSGPRMDAWREAILWLERRPRSALERAVVHGLGPELLAGVDLEALVTRLADWTGLFDLPEELVR